MFSNSDLRLGIMVMWSKMFDHDHRQNLKITMPWPNGQNLAMTMAQNPYSDSRNGKRPITFELISALLVLFDIFFI